MERPATAAKARIARFWRHQDGATTLAAVLFIPLFLMIFMSSVEISTLAIRQAMLDRAVDQTSRILRLGIEPLPDHALLKRAICNRLAIVPGCIENLTVEVVEVDKTSWSTTRAGTAATCVDLSEEATPEMLIQRGQSDQLMLMRVCLKVKPMMPGAGVGARLTTDGSGALALVVATVFVNEPR
jgi:Flp pilus assembly protein TadG